MRYIILALALVAVAILATIYKGEQQQKGPELAPVTTSTVVVVTPKPSP